MSKHPEQNDRNPRKTFRGLGLIAAIVILAAAVGTPAQNLEPVEVEGQPLANNVHRLLQALDYLGAPLPADQTAALEKAGKGQDPLALQKLLDPHVLVVVNVN